jgi:uncharacterized protein YecE (DUF72 family)
MATVCPTNPHIRIGCCGFAGARARYFKTFGLVEVQQTFYDPPQLKTAEKWRADAPTDFEFTVKAWQLITHTANSPTYRRLRKALSGSEQPLVGNFQVTKPVLHAWETTAEIARALRVRVILFQCPASFTPTDENLANMRKFFSTVKREDFLVAWEPRGKWEDSTIQSLCKALDLIHCVDPFVRQPVTTGVHYFRLHGIGGYRYQFTDENLRWLRTLCRKGKATYFLLNNLSMFDDALRLRRMAQNSKA